MKKILLVVFIFSTLISVQANDVLVFVDHTRNLDYFREGKLYKIKHDLKKLYKQYQYNSEKRIIIVEVLKDNQKKFKGRVRVIGRNIKKRRRFRNKKSLIDLLKRYINNSIKPDFLLLSHTLNKTRLEQFLSYANTRYGVIFSSACKMATPEKLKIMKNYSSLVLASPENIHLAHLELNALPKILKKEDAQERGKLMLNYSYDRLLKFTKSNLVLHLYNLNNLTDNECYDLKWDDIIIDSRIKLSRFETKDLKDFSFKIYNCKNKY